MSDYRMQMYKTFWEIPLQSTAVPCSKLLAGKGAADARGHSWEQYGGQCDVRGKNIIIRMDSLSLVYRTHCRYYVWRSVDDHSISLTVSFEIICCQSPSLPSTNSVERLMVLCPSSRLCPRQTKFSARTGDSSTGMVYGFIVLHIEIESSLLILAET